tara:strand:+ start:225 stop:605 length:381 start_codon:yes stop_codon:yes gene_type:complete
MKTYQELRLEFLDLKQRKAVGRRMAQIAKKKSTQMKKARNKLRPWSKEKLRSKAQKAVRKIVMQKLAGKSKDISDLGLVAKEKLEKAADKKMKGGKMKAFVVKKEKQLQKKHLEDIKKAKEKMKEK